ncbi:MAG: hypothetical protein IKS41_02725 [Alphaproteobacteria bacterium]|nr:hypothetical protein [Alphaproteobacteria bacterium]
MKYFFSLLFSLFFSFQALAIDCPADKPLLGNDGICYSCDEENTVTINEEALGKSCSDICPNRDSSGFFTDIAVPCMDKKTVALDNFIGGSIIFILIMLAGAFCILVFLLPIYFFYQLSKTGKKEKVKNKKTLIVFFIFFLICVVPWIILIVIDKLTLLPVYK